MDNRLTILLDCDDTISVFMQTCIETYNKIYGTNHSIEEITDWDISGIFEHRLWSIFDKCDVLQHMPIKDGAFEIIKKWHELGHKIIIVTGVHNVESYADKLRWLELTGLKPYIYEVVPTRHKEIINGDIFIDDNADYLREWSKHHDGLALLMTAQHNKNKPELNQEFSRVDTWAQINEIVEIYTK